LENVENNRVLSKTEMKMKKAKEFSQKLKKKEQFQL